MRLLDEPKLKHDVSIRRRILDAALDIVAQQGVKALTQPRVAKAAGVRQSHLTYYFPRKADLFVALLQASHGRSRASESPSTPETFNEAMETLRGLMDPQRMRFFLSILVESGDAENLRPVIAEHARSLAKTLAPHFGRESSDPAIIAFIDQLRGLGLRMLMEPDEELMRGFDPAAFAGRFGLERK